jgi:hypothetical protein
MHHDYIPVRDADFSNWFKHIVDYVKAKTAGGVAAEWTHIPNAFVDELEAAYIDWNANYQPTLNPHTPAQTTAKKNARAQAEKVIRIFVRRFLSWFPPVSEEDRQNMGLPSRDTIRRATAL